jgi:phenylacetate-CoA ligase
LPHTLYSRALESILLPAHNLARGRNYVRHRKFLEESQWWKRQALMDFQWREMRALVEHAFKTVPYYQKKYADVGIRLQDIQTPQDFARLPVLTRQEIQAHREEMRSTAYRGRFMPHATGGSSGVPTRFYLTIESYDWRTACTERVYSYTGCKLGEPSLYLWGALIGKVPTWKALKIKAFEKFRGQLFFSTFAQTDDQWAEILKQAKRHRPKFVVGYNSSLEGFAKFLLANKLTLPSVQAVIAAAEPLFPSTRAVLELGFGAPVFNTYGSREFMSMAGECEHHNGLHVNCENILLETARPAAEGPSDILVTDLHNFGMPFLRYSIGDLGVLDESPCKCGRGLPRIAAIDGRIMDALRAPGGRVVPGEFVPHVMKDIPEVIEFQMRQVSLTKLVLQAVLSEELSAKSQEILRSEIEKAFGPEVVVEVSRVESIPKLPSGKRRISIGLEG